MLSEAALMLEVVVIDCDADMRKNEEQRSLLILP